MKSDTWPGLVEEKQRSGNKTWRVRTEGDPRKRIALGVDPTHPDFARQYFMARAGKRPAKLHPTLGRLMATGDVRQNLFTAWTRARSRASETEREFSISVEFLDRILELQNYQCAVSGLEFSFSKTDGKNRRAFAPSIDRIDCAKGYTPENVRLTLAIVNTGLADWGMENFVAMCRAVAKRY